MSLAFVSGCLWMTEQRAAAYLTVFGLDLPAGFLVLSPVGRQGLAGSVVEASVATFSCFFRHVISGALGGGAVQLN